MTKIEMTETTTTGAFGGTETRIWVAFRGRTVGYLKETNGDLTAFWASNAVAPATGTTADEMALSLVLASMRRHARAIYAETGDLDAAADWEMEA